MSAEVDRKLSRMLRDCEDDRADHRFLHSVSERVTGSIFERDGRREVWLIIHGVRGRIPFDLLIDPRSAVAELQRFVH